ncbi:MAG TPA: hypothetical protein VF519_01030 [Mycobacteriales bacterium]|jgi:hypothetical protein
MALVPGAHRAPRYVTILVAVVLALLGLLGTFGSVLPDKVGAYLEVAATVVLLLGVFVPGL